MRFKNIFAMLTITFFITACGDTRQFSAVSFSVSDAPVDDAEKVVIAFDKLEFIRANGEQIVVEVDDDQTGHDYQQIDLLDFPGTKSTQILTDQELPTGQYQNLIIHIKPDQDLNYVIAQNGLLPLKQPSNKLKLGRFTVENKVIQSFTIEFDLRQALVLRGNNSNNSGYNLKPHGVTIINNAGAASLSGTVDLNLFNAGSCVNDTGNHVYIYEGFVLFKSKLADNFDPTDVDFDDSGLSASGFIAPYASTGINLTNGQYQFGFLPAGDYTVTFSCSAVADDPVQFDGLTIPEPSTQIVLIKLSATQVGIHDFNE
jgi:hypothetical protein